MRGFPFNSFRLRNILTQYQFDLTAAKAVCGPLPYTIEQGVKETAAWFNRSGRLKLNSLHNSEDSV
jgi:hypothetical protein